ncbi:MAG: leucine-rich repeat protein [Ruminococcus sp.]|nr:leucine-rich repeat protein [Ruminococcus sp.]
MKRLLSILLAAITVMLFATSCGSSDNKKKTDTLVSVRMRDNAALRYEFAVYKNRKFTVKRVVENKKATKVEKAEGTADLSDKQYNKIKKLIGNIKDFYGEDYADEYEIFYEISLNGGKYTEPHEYGSSFRTGYDFVLTELIKLSPIDMIDSFNAKISPKYQDSDSIDEEDIGKNPNIDVDYDKATKTLIFSGKGRMEDYEYNTPWYDVAQPFNIVVKDGITRICNEAFSASIDGNSGTPRYDFQYTKSIKLPDSVTEIGSEAFYYCCNLTEITLPKNLKKLGAMAFMECKKLKRIEIPEGVTRIRGDLFSRCENLEEVVLSSKTEVIGDSAFYDTKIKEIKLPGTLTKIEYSAFGGCENLREITIPDSVKTIEEDAFERCGFKSVTIPKSVTTIEEEAFGYSGSGKIKGFTIKGYRGSEAEKYAKKNGFKFIYL